MTEKRNLPAESAFPRPRVAPFPLALASTLLGEADPVSALWDASHGRSVRGVSYSANLAAMWLGLFIGEEGPSARRNPALPMGVLPHFPQLLRAGLIEEIGGPGEAPSFGLSRSNWDLLFLSAINPKTVSALRQVMMLGWSSGAAPIPLSEITRTIPPVKVEGELSRVRVPQEVVLAGMHLGGHKIDLSSGSEPLIFVDTPRLTSRRLGSDFPVPSLFDGGWLTPLAEGARTDLHAGDHLNRKTSLAHLFRAADLLRDPLQDAAWDPEVGLNFRFIEGASGLSLLFTKNPGDFATRSQGGEYRFLKHFNPLSRTWFEGLGAQYEAMGSTNRTGLWPEDPKTRDAQILLLLAQEGVQVSRASAAGSPLIRPEAFRDLTRDHADAEKKSRIDELLQLRGGVLKNPVARFWQSLCLRMPDRTVQEMGAEPAPDADARLNAIRICDLLVVHPRKPVMILLSEAERAGCRGIVSVSETGPDAPVDVFQIEVKDQETLAQGLFNRPVSDPSDRDFQPFKRRNSVLNETSLDDMDAAVRALNRSSLSVRKPRHYQVTHDYLTGKDTSEIAGELGITRARVNGIIQTAVRIVTEEREVTRGPRDILNTLSSRSQNALSWRSFGTDNGIRRLVAKYGSAALLAIPNLGKDSHAEICNAYGFNPDEKIRLPGLEKKEADQLRAMPNRARDRHSRNRHLLDIIEADPDITIGTDTPKKTPNLTPEEIEEMNSWGSLYNGGRSFGDHD